MKWKWFKRYETAPVRRPGDRIIQSWDTASKAEETNNYSVCTTWQVRRNEAWLLDVFRVKLEFPELRRRIESEAKRHAAFTILIEQAGSGIPLIQDLKRNTHLNVIGVVPRDSKATRLLAVSPMIEGGRVAIPENATWLADFQREITLFPKGKHDDQVDSLSQFLTWFDQPSRTVYQTAYD